METISVDEFRQHMIERFANCLLGDFERGAITATYNAPQLITGIDLVSSYGLGDLEKQVEYILNLKATQHEQQSLRAVYVVVVDNTDSHLRFTACVRPA